MQSKRILQVTPELRKVDTVNKSCQTCQIDNNHKHKIGRINNKYKQHARKKNQSNQITLPKREGIN